MRTLAMLLSFSFVWSTLAAADCVPPRVNFRQIMQVADYSTCSTETLEILNQKVTELMPTAIAELADPEAIGKAVDVANLRAAHALIKIELQKRR